MTERFYGSVRVSVEKVRYILKGTLESSNGPSILAKKRKEKGKINIKSLPRFLSLFFIYNMEQPFL